MDSNRPEGVLRDLARGPRGTPGSSTGDAAMGARRQAKQRKYADGVVLTAAVTAGAGYVLGMPAARR